MLTFALFVLGFALLVKGADFLVEGASSIAKRLGVSDLVIGLTIVAFGTSMPELVVNIMAATKGSTDIAIGNILGSNSANILLILGIVALIRPIEIKRNTTWKEIPLVVLATLVLFAMANDRILDKAASSGITRIDGLVLMAFFTIYMSYVFSLAKSEKPREDGHGPKSLWMAILMTMGGLVMLALGGDWVVRGAIAAAKAFGVSESLIGLTIVAVGTSLPELMTSIVATMKKNSDIAIGNIVGSNIFNIFWILGVSAIIRPLPFNTVANLDVAVALAAATLLFVFCFTPKIRRIIITTESYSLERLEGGVLLATYIAYIVYLVWRG